MAALFAAEQRTWEVTGFPAVLIIIAILALIIGLGVLIGRRTK